MTLSELRRAVDRVDDDLVRLLNRRTALAREIGHMKRACGLPLYDPAREAEVLRRVRARSRREKGALDEHAIGRLFERIIDEARQVEITDGEEDHGRGNGRARVGKPAGTRRRAAR